jgi:hypothetical protein
MEAASGFHVGCPDCHVRDATTRDPRLPGHNECGRCHNAPGAANEALSLKRCAGCHRQRNVELVRGRTFIGRDLLFAHSNHEVDKAGAAIPCTTCHVSVPTSTSHQTISPPTMQSCAGCHEDAAKSPARVRIAKCNVCHVRITSGLAPRSHSVGQLIPEDHTLGFRKDHGEQARAKDARCSYCHIGLSGSPKDSCYECHQVWRPRDHTINWREDEHGREAASERDRCVTCHTSEYCAACHSIPPRSHQPLGDFRTGGHAELARFDLRACFACHTWETTCSVCHRSLR